MKDHKKRQLIEELVATARTYSQAEQLRDRIAYALSGVFSELDEAPARAERAEAELKKAREQEPVAFWWVGPDGEDNGGPYRGIPSDAAIATALRSGCCPQLLYASPIPTPAASSGDWTLQTR